MLVNVDDRKTRVNCIEEQVMFPNGKRKKTRGLKVPTNETMKFLAKEKFAMRQTWSSRER